MGADYQGVVAIVFAVIVVCSNLLFTIRLRKKRISLGEDSETGMKIYVMYGISSPFLMWNKVYLSPKVSSDDNRRRHSVLHEYCHYKHGDMFWNTVKYLLLTLYWFDPLIWLALDRCGKDSELACDESVIDIIGAEHRAEYGETLLSFLSRSRREKLLTISTSMDGQSKSFLRTRIVNISRSFKKSRLVIVSVILVMAIVGGCALTDPFKRDDGSDELEESIVLDGAEETVREGTEESADPTEAVTGEDIGENEPEETMGPIDISAAKEPVNEYVKLLDTGAGPDSYCIYDVNSDYIAYVELEYPDEGFPDYAEDYTSAVLKLADHEGNIQWETDLPMADYKFVRLSGAEVFVVSGDGETDKVEAYYDGNSILDYTLDYNVYSAEANSSGDIYLLDYNMYFPQTDTHLMKLHTDVGSGNDVRYYETQDQSLIHLTKIDGEVYALKGRYTYTTYKNAEDILSGEDHEEIYADDARGNLFLSVSSESGLYFFDMYGNLVYSSRLVHSAPADRFYTPVKNQTSFNCHYIVEKLNTIPVRAVADGSGIVANCDV